MDWVESISGEQGFRTFSGDCKDIIYGIILAEKVNPPSGNLSQIYFLINISNLCKN